jgi:vacuolar-type H+-ATPase subunit I/STV1
MKKPLLELIPGLRIGVGAGRLILSHKIVDEDGLERWAINYHLTVDGPIRDAFYLSANVLRYIAKVETLERGLKSSKEYSRRLKIRKEELEAQLAKSENLRDVAQKTNKQRIDELEAEVNKLDHDNTSLAYAYDECIESIKENKENAKATAMQFKQLNSIINSEKDQNKIAFKIIDKLKFWNMVCSILGLMFFALWLSAIYF